MKEGKDKLLISDLRVDVCKNDHVIVLDRNTEKDFAYFQKPGSFDSASPAKGNFTVTNNDLLLPSLKF